MKIVHRPSTNRVPLIKAIHQRLLAEKSAKINAEERKGEK